MLFILRMAGREARASWKRLVFFFLCVALGVGAVAMMRSVIQNVRIALAREAKSLVGGDVVVQSNSPFDDTVRDMLEAELRSLDAGGGRIQRTELVETATMVRPEAVDKAVTRMVELQAVDPAFPLYGAVALQDGRRYRHDLLKGGGVLVRPELLVQLDTRVGERLLIGHASFEIRGVLSNEPGRRPGAFSLGPRVLIAASDLPGTGLLTFGSRARYRVLLKMREEAAEGFASRLRPRLRERFVQVRSFRDTEERLGRELETAENYLSLVGYIIVVLGGIGVWSVTRVFISQKIPTIAVLKCLGGSTGRILGIYVAQVLLLGATGSVLGLAVAALALGQIPKDVVAALTNVAFGLTWSASAQAFAIGLLVSLLFALVPLLEVRQVRPLLLLRDDAGPPPTRHSPIRQSQNPHDRGSAPPWQDAIGWLRRIDWLRLLVSAAVVTALAMIASWQVASWRIGLIVSAGFVGVALVLFLAGAGLVKLVRPVARVAWFPLRHAIAGFGRPGHQTRVILLAVGLGCFFILGIRLLEANLHREFAIDLRPDGPDLFLIDIQRDQRADVERFLRDHGGGGEPRLVPVLRARVVGVTGRRGKLSSIEEIRERGSISREFVLTWRGALSRNERVVEGRFWDGSPSATAEVSVEQGIRERGGLEIGDRLRFDVLGRIVEATITSVRSVDWDDAREGGFVFVFRPGVLERAPHNYIAILRGPQDGVARARMQRALVDRFPNVSAIDVRDVVASIQRVVRHVTLAISVVGSVALACGLLILIGSVAMTKFQRLREVALLKTLGATGRTIAAMLLIEYGVLGLLAGIIGATGALTLSYVFTSRVLEIPWHPEPGLLVGGVLLTVAVVAVVGVLASLDVLRRKPLAVLRAG
jgi:putative ABC transport system permease protein